MADKTEVGYRFEIFRDDNGKALTKWDLSRGLLDGVTLKLTIKLSKFDNPAGGPNGVNDRTSHKVEVGLTGVEREDGSNESWNLRGYVKTDGPLKGAFTGYTRTDIPPRVYRLGFLFLTL